MFLLLWRKKLGKCTYKLPAQVLLKVYGFFVTFGGKICCNEIKSESDILLLTI